jgi:hypothetical protein
MAPTIHPAIGHICVPGSSHAETTGRRPQFGREYRVKGTNKRIQDSYSRGPGVRVRPVAAWSGLSPLEGSVIVPTVEGPVMLIVSKQKNWRSIATRVRRLCSKMKSVVDPVSRTVQLKISDDPMFVRKGVGADAAQMTQPSTAARGVHGIEVNLRRPDRSKQSQEDFLGYLHENLYQLTYYNTLNCQAYGHLVHCLQDRSECKSPNPDARIREVPL